MNIYSKLAAARADFHSRALKKSGHNKFANYRYFELGDFLIPGMDALAKQGLTPIISFGADTATMTVHGDGNETIVITSPIAPAELKGCHPIQNLGAVQTYLRRYLWTALLEIAEHDAIDSSEPVESKPQIDEVLEVLIEEARTAAKIGRDEFAKFWKLLHPKERAALNADQSLIAELKQTAEAA